MTSHVTHRIFAVIRPVDIVMCVALSLATTETFSYFYGISNLQHPGYLRTLSAWPVRFPLECVLVFFAMLCLALLSVASIHLGTMASPRSLGSLLKVLGRDVLFALLLTPFLSMKAVTVADAVLCLLPPLILVVMSRFAQIARARFLDEPVALLPIPFLWFVAYSVLIVKYVQMGRIYDAGVINNWGYWKDGILMWIILNLVALVPPVLRQVMLRSDFARDTKVTIGVSLSVGVSAIGVIAAWLDYTFPDSRDGANYVAALTEQLRLSEQLGTSLFSIIKWHGLVRSGILLLVGVVFVFVLEALRGVLRELQKPRSTPA